jgi:hypothetical protein
VPQFFPAVDMLRPNLNGRQRWVWCTRLLSLTGWLFAALFNQVFIRELPENPLVYVAVQRRDAYGSFVTFSPFSFKSFLKSSLSVILLQLQYS